MPIYEYHCSKCGDFEVMQKISEKELRTCPTCRRKVTKLISSTSFHLKGSGWYITDYARKGDSASKSATDGKGEAKSEAKSESKSGTAASDSKGDSKSESKSDTKSDAKSDSKSDSKTSKAKSDKSAAA
jgi:putative FmdB family regulatory protein